MWWWKKTTARVFGTQMKLYFVRWLVAGGSSLFVAKKKYGISVTLSIMMSRLSFGAAY